MLGIGPRASNARPYILGHCKGAALAAPFLFTKINGRLQLISRDYSQVKTVLDKEKAPRNQRYIADSSGLHAADRDRTGTVSLPRDFKSLASASSATAAQCTANFSIHTRNCQAVRMGVSPLLFENSRMMTRDFGQKRQSVDFYLFCAHLDFSISSRALARLSSVTLSPEIMRASTSTRPSISRVWISVKVRSARTFFWIRSWLSAKAATCGV